DARQVHVHQHQVGPQLASELHRRLAGLGLTDHLEAVGRLDHSVRGHSKRRLVVDDENSYRHAFKFEDRSTCGARARVPAPPLLGAPPSPTRWGRITTYP